MPKTKVNALSPEFNAIGFQSMWWACVIGVITGFPGLGPIGMGVFLAAQNKFLIKNKEE